MLNCICYNLEQLGTIQWQLWWNYWSMFVSITKASKLVGVARQTINRHIREGKLSASSRNGKRVIDTSELIRVYGELSIVDSLDNGTKSERHVTLSSNLQNEQIALLVMKIEELTQVVNDLTYRIEHKDDRHSESNIHSLGRPEDDPLWPKKVNTLADVALRNEIKLKYTLIK